MRKLVSLILAIILLIAFSGCFFEVERGEGPGDHHGGPGKHEGR